jgi:hypothetical protein
MNEIKRGYYSAGMHNINADFSGLYTSLTIRSDVKTWLEENYETLKEEYDRRYKANSFTQFAGIFMLNMFESKAAAQNNNVIRLKEALIFVGLLKNMGRENRNIRQNMAFILLTNLQIYF